jgi:hypothetical protein
MGRLRDWLFAFSLSPFFTGSRRAKLALRGSG